MSRLRILHVNTERGWRGGEVQTLLLAKGLARRGHEELLAVPPGSGLASRGSEAGLRTAVFDSRGELDPLGAGRLARLCREYRPDLLHYHTSHAVSLGTLASYLSGRRPAVASRRVSFPLSRNPLARLKYTHRLDRILAVSAGIRDLLLAAGIPAARIQVVHSAVDLERFQGLPSRDEARRELGYGPGDFLVGSVGHLAEHKGHHVLVKAARRLAVDGSRYRFLVIGAGERERELRDSVRREGLGSVFRFMGFSEEVERHLPALDLLAFPSLSGEGSPAALKEAMACGLPVVASRISGVDEVLRDGMEGLLVPRGDATALSGAIERVANDENLRLEFGRRGRERAREFGVERMVDATESIYREVLRGPRA